MRKSQPDRREHQRFDLTCPIVVTDSTGKELLRTQTLNISDGGALVLSRQAVPLALGDSVEADLRVPRSTPNTFLLEEVNSPARVVRQCESGLAIAFIEPLRLELDT